MEQETAQRSLPQRSTPPSWVKSGPTPRQESFIRSLMSDLGISEEDLERPVSEYSVPEASALLDRLLAKQKDVKTHAAESTVPTTKGIVPEQGAFAVVMGGDEDQVTLRIYTPKMGRFAKRKVIQYLYGPDNTSDYRTFGLVVEDGVSIWPQYLRNKRLVDAVGILLGLDPDGQIAAGERYALRSNNCWRCGRDLTRETSITRGTGPVCARKLGLA